MSVEKAAELQTADPDYGIRDLYNSIKKGDYPSWTLYIQVMTVEQAKSHKDNPFDLTKVWSQREYPLIPVGQLVLNRNPANYFTDVEQIAFSPDHFIPGIEASPDKMLQARIFAYNDTHRHRLGANFLQLPVNCPYRVSVNTYHRDGPMCYQNNADPGAPNYFPNSFGGAAENGDKVNTPYKVDGFADRYQSGEDNNFEQPRLFYRNVLNEQERTRLINNIVGHLKMAADFIQERAVKNFSKVDEELGSRIASGLRLAKTNKANL